MRFVGCDGIVRLAGVFVTQKIHRWPYTPAKYTESDEREELEQMHERSMMQTVVTTILDSLEKT